MKTKMMNKNEVKKSEKEKYKELFMSYRTLGHFWDADLNRPKIGSMTSARGLSSGEVVIVRCLVSIWRGNGRGQEVNITDVAALPGEDRKPLVMYLVNPCKP